MDARYPEWLEALERKTRSEQRDGYTFVTKPIPEDEADAPGRMDPRVYAVQKKLFDEMPQGFSLPLDPSDPIAFAKTMRALMGWDNEDVTGGAVSAVGRTIEGSGGPIPVRIYTPPGERLRRAIVFFHGGGFIGGTLRTVENPCKCLALRADAVVVSVDYRLAPEHPFPAGVDDCWDAVRWVSEHAGELGVRPGPLAVAGDSAGGNLAAVCALRDRDERTGRIGYQALIYPTVNMGALPTEEGGEWKLDAYEISDEHRDVIIPDLLAMKGDGTNPLLRLYLQDNAEPDHPYAAPLHADLSGLPETLIATAEYDYLRLEDEAYARKLAKAGVATTLIQYNGTSHGFMDKSGLFPQVEDVMKEIAAGFRRAMNRLEEKERATE